jgi:hypothetical protein
MGLETVHPEVLERLNKRMTVEHFRQAARRLADFGADLRVFLLVHPPFMDPADAFQWAQRSVDEAFDCGATVVSLIPTRAGNGAMDELRQAGLFTPPTLAELERAVEYGLELKRGRVFADLWDLERFSDCPSCFAARRERLLRMNLAQRTCPPVSCEQCGGGAR